MPPTPLSFRPMGKVQPTKLRSEHRDHDKPSCLLKVLTSFWFTRAAILFFDPSTSFIVNKILGDWARPTSSNWDAQ
jgi:hypothetical protein